MSWRGCVAQGLSVALAGPFVCNLPGFACLAAQVCADFFT
jgi:hypothetical protein